MKLQKNKLIFFNDKNLYSSYQKFFFTQNKDISRQKVLQYFQDKNRLKLNYNQCIFCEKYLTEDQVNHELNKMKIKNFPGNDVLAKELYEPFWDHVKLLSFKIAFLKKELSTSQKQAVIKLIEKKGPTQTFYKKLEIYIFT